MFVVQRLEPHFPQASKTSIGHVVQLLYRASCFKVTKRDGDSSLMQLKEEFRTYDTLRREHDTQIVQIATEGGLRIAPDQWSSLLYGDSAHKSHMQVLSLNSATSFLSILHFSQLWTSCRLRKVLDSRCRSLSLLFRGQGTLVAWLPSGVSWTASLASTPAQSLSPLLGTKSLDLSLPLKQW